MVTLWCLCCLLALLFSFTEMLLQCPLKPRSRLTCLVMLSPLQFKRRLIKASPEGVKTDSVQSFSACWSTWRHGPAMIRAAGKAQNYSHLVGAANRAMSDICLHVPACFRSTQMKDWKQGCRVIVRKVVNPARYCFASQQLSFLSFLCKSVWDCCCWNSREPKLSGSREETDYGNGESKNNEHKDPFQAD